MTLQEMLSEMNQKVFVELYVADFVSSNSEEMVAFLREVTNLNDLLELNVIDASQQEAVSIDYKIERSLAIILLDEARQYHRVKYCSLPAGYEIQSFLAVILAMAGEPFKLLAALQSRIEKIKQPVNLKVFITLGCPHCPQAVHKAYQIAMLNEHVTAEMLDAEEFYALSSLHHVSSVAQIVINDELNLIGNVPMSLYLDKMESILN